MPNLDPQTLLVMVSLIYFLAGFMTFFAAANSPDAKVLQLAGLAALLGGFAFSIGFLTVALHYWSTLAIWNSNTLLLLSNALLLASLRTYTHTSTNWPLILAGPISWLVLCMWPPFLTEINYRIAVFSALIVLYSLAMIVQLWRHKIINVWETAPIYFVLALHCLFYLYRIATTVLASNFFAPPNFIVTSLENVFFMVVFVYSLLIMVYKRTETAFRQAALHDELTTLPNRRAFFANAHKLIESAEQNGENITALMCDLDKFKQINDQFGHERGNQILILFANTIKKHAPEGTLYARIGGEEFVLLLKHTSTQTSTALAQSIRKDFHVQSSPRRGQLSVSIGIACSSQVGYDIDALLISADSALYHAKESGRNQVQIWCINTAESATPTTALRRPTKLQSN